MPLERPLITSTKFHLYKYQIKKNLLAGTIVLSNHSLSRGETYPKVASASPPPVRENGRRLLQHQSSGRKTRKTSWSKFRLCTENVTEGERQPEKASTP
jgi:hypothetical protein